MAVTDRLAADGPQHRVWVVTMQGALTSKVPDVVEGGWFVHRGSVRSGVDAVSFVDAAALRQRVFFATGGQVRMLRFDDDRPGGERILPAPPDGIMFDDTDVAAVLFRRGSETRIAVASISTDGRVCVWDGPFDVAAKDPLFPAPVCTRALVAERIRPDIAGSDSRAGVSFFYRTTSDKLGVTERNGSGAYSTRDLDLGPRSPRFLRERTASSLQQSR